MEWERTYRRTMIGGPATGRTRRECWGATSADGVWSVERLEETGTPWALMHLPTRTDAGLFGTLKAAQRWAASEAGEIFLEELS